jgi:hypothetical protein
MTDVKCPYHEYANMYTDDGNTYVCLICFPQDTDLLEATRVQIAIDKANKAMQLPEVDGP